MDRRNTKVAVIEIGETGMPHGDWDYYYFPDDVSEWEIAEEISNLVEFYDELVWPIVGPPHIRLDKVKEWVYREKL